MAAVLADTTGKMCWGWDCYWDEGLRCSAQRKCKVHLHGTLALGDHVHCKLGSRHICSSSFVWTSPAWLFDCLSWQRVATLNRGCHLSLAAAALTRAGSNSSSPGGPHWQGLPLAFVLHSSISCTVTRAPKEAVALDRNSPRANHWANASQVQIAQEKCSTEKLRPLDFFLLLIVLKCSNKEKSAFFSWFWFAHRVCHFSHESESVANTMCWASNGYIQSSFLAVRWRTAIHFIAQRMDKESLVACGTLSRCCFFSTWCSYITQGPVHTHWI